MSAVPTSCLAPFVGLRPFDLREAHWFLVANARPRHSPEKCAPAVSVRWSAHRARGSPRSFVRAYCRPSPQMVGSMSSPGRARRRSQPWRQPSRGLPASPRTAWPRPVAFALMPHCAPRPTASPRSPRPWRLRRRGSSWSSTSSRSYSATVRTRARRLGRPCARRVALTWSCCSPPAARGAGRLHIVLTMRSDYFGNCSAYQGLAEAVSAGQYLVPLPDRDQLETAIREPVEKAGAIIEDGLVQRLLVDVEEETDQLPLFQHTLRRLWDAAQGEPRSAAGG